MKEDYYQKSEMPIKHGDKLEFYFYGKAKVCNTINHTYLEQSFYKYDIEYPYLYSPGRTFFGQSKQIGGDIYICSCMKTSIQNFLNIKYLHGNYMNRNSTPLDVEFFPLEVAKKSITNFKDPIGAISFLDKICPVCQGVIIGPKSPIFSLYVDQYIYANGISFFHDKYIKECPEDFKSVFDRINKVAKYYNKKLIVSGYSTSYMYNLLSEQEKEELYHNTRERYYFKNSFKNEIRKRMGFKAIGETLVSESTLFSILDKRFKGYTTFKHYHPPILQGLELDYYIAELKIGFEYQGKQHFEPIEHFGGAEKLKKQQQNDKLKLERCNNSGIFIIYINYYDSLEESHINEIINEKLKHRP